MLFATKLVESNATGMMLIKVSVLAMIFMFICLLLPTLSFLAPFFLVFLLILIIGTAIFTKGNLSSYKLENDLVVFDTEIQISQIVFPMDELKELKFYFMSFNGMRFPTYETETDIGSSRNYGLENRISFRYKKQKFDYKFYVQSQQHFHSFVQMLEQLYVSHINFGEQNWKGKTFLMQNVTEEQYQHLMRKYQHY
ncbi:MAG: hypothetical protein V4722_20825 [Bacteroidota bacterium]